MDKTMAFDSNPADDSAGPANTSEQEPDVKDPNEASEGETLSLEIFGGKTPAVGDKVTLEVTAVDPENGTVEVSMPDQKAAGGGIDGLNSALDGVN